MRTWGDLTRLKGTCEDMSYPPYLGQSKEPALTGFRFRTSGLATSLGVGVRVSGFGLRVSGVATLRHLSHSVVERLSLVNVESDVLRVSDFGFWVSGFEF